MVERLQMRQVLNRRVQYTGEMTFTGKQGQLITLPPVIVPLSRVLRFGASNCPAFRRERMRLNVRIWRLRGEFRHVGAMVGVRHG
jgi:hypothetical protein